MVDRIGLAFLVLAFAAADKKVGSVEGKVTFDGKAIAKGKVSFHPAVGKVIEVDVKDGAYSAPSVAAGKTRLTVKADGLPPKYADETTSGLTYEVKPGKQLLDIALSK